MEIPITQSDEWAKLQSDFGEKHFFTKGNGYQFLAILKTTPVGKYLYLPYGPYINSKNDTSKVLAARAMRKIRKIATEENAIFIRIEPQIPNFTENFPYKIKKSTDLNPKETWILDLDGTNDELKAKLPSRLLRYYKNLKKMGLRIETSHNPEDIKYLLDLQKALANKKGINTFSENYLKTELAQPFATLYLVKYNRSLDGRVTDLEGIPQNSRREELREGKVRQDPSMKESAISADNVVAAGLVFDDEHTRYNLQGAQSEQGRKLHATGILTIQLIKDAKAKNLKYFDFWGIAPDDAPANHPWKGFTNFKKTFAGREVKYAGTQDIILKPFKYHIYRLTRNVNRLLRRI